MVELQGLRAVVTGALRGIGAHGACALADRGVDLVLVARTEATLRTVADRAAFLHVRAVPVVADLADPSAPARIIEAATAALGGVRLGPALGVTAMYRHAADSLESGPDETAGRHPASKRLRPDRKR